MRRWRGNSLRIAVGSMGIAGGSLRIAGCAASALWVTGGFAGLRRRPGGRPPSARRAGGPCGPPGRTPKPRPRPCRRIAHRRRNAGDAGLAFGDALRPAAPAHLEEGALAENRVGEEGALGRGIGPRRQHLRAGAGRHRQPGADRHGVAQAGRGLGGGDADALHAVAAVELDALAGDVPQPWAAPRSRRPAGGPSRRRPARPARRRAPAAVGPAAQQAVHLQAHGEPVRGRARQTGAAAQLREAARLLGDGAGAPPRPCPELRCRYAVP